MSWGGNKTTSLRYKLLCRDIRQEFATQNRKQTGPNVGRASQHGRYQVNVRATTQAWISREAWGQVVERMDGYEKPLPPLPKWVTPVERSTSDCTYAYPVLKDGITVQLCSTDIAVWDELNLKLYAGGWHTTMTEGWINEALRGINTGVWVHPHRLNAHTLPQWVVATDLRPLRLVSAFYDGITFDCLRGGLVSEARAPELKVLRKEEMLKLRRVLREMRALYQPFYMLHLGQTNAKIEDDMRLPEVQQLFLHADIVYGMAKAMLEGKPCPLKGTYYEYLSLYLHGGQSWGRSIASGWVRVWDSVAKMAVARDPDVYLSREKYPLESE